MNPANLLSSYIDYLNRICGFATRTVAFHRRICKWWHAFLIENRGKDLLQVHPDDLLQWILHRREQEVQNVTIQKEMCVLRTLYQFLFDFGHLPTNPADCLPELICRPADEQQYLTVKECFDFLDAFDRNTVDGNRNYVITALLWSTGLRSGELCSLTWRDIDIEEGTLLVRKGKSGRQRLLFLNHRILEDMQQYHELAGGKDFDPVFASLTKNQHTKSTGFKALSQSALVDMIRHHASRLALGKDISPKTFQHTFATDMLEAGVSLEDIKEMLGHDDETETCVYIHVTAEAARRLLENHSGNPANLPTQGD